MIFKARNTLRRTPLYCTCCFFLLLGTGVGVMVADLLASEQAELDVNIITGWDTRTIRRLCCSPWRENSCWQNGSYKKGCEVFGGIVHTKYSPVSYGFKATGVPLWQCGNDRKKEKWTQKSKNVNVKQKIREKASHLHHVGRCTETDAGCRLGVLSL